MSIDAPREDTVRFRPKYDGRVVERREYTVTKPVTVAVHATVDARGFVLNGAGLPIGTTPAEQHVPCEPLQIHPGDIISWQAVGLDGSLVDVTVNGKKFCIFRQQLENVEIELPRE